MGGGRGGGDASISEHLPVFRAPREADGRMHQSTDEGRMHQSTDAKKSHGKGTKSVSRASGTDIATTRPKRPKGRFGENYFVHRNL